MGVGEARSPPLSNRSVHQSTVTSVERGNGREPVGGDEDEVDAEGKWRRSA